MSSALKANGLLPDRVVDIMRYVARSTADRHEHRWMTETANAQSSLNEISELIPLYFYRLKNTSAIAAFLLLNTFTLQRETEELRESRQELEDCIAKLKSRIAELEEGDGAARPVGQQKHVHVLSAENARLRLAQAELCRINQQWALDYEALAKERLAPEAEYGTTREQPTNETYRQMEQRIKELSSEVASQTQNVREAVQRVRLLEDEKRAIHMQLQELGDLDEVLTWKNDVTRLRTLLKQKDQQYQEVIAINVLTRKQLQRLQHAFLQVLVPRPNRRSTFTAARRPDHTYTLPPTPPGLLARTEVDKDLQAPPNSHAHHMGSQLSGLIVPGLVCPSCSRVMEGTACGYHQWCEHVQSCGN